MRNLILDRKWQTFKENINSTRIILLVGGIAGFVFGFFDERSFQHVSTLNYGISILSFLCLVWTFFIKEESTSSFVILFYFVSFNIINIVIVYVTNLDTTYSFEYLIFFILSSHVFINRRNFFINLFINILGILVIFILNKTNATYSDFLSTVSFSMIAVYIIANRRFSEKEKVESSEGKYRMLAENSADMICTHKQGGRFNFVSPSCYSLLGYSPNDLVGMLPSEFIHKEDLTFFQEHFFERLSTDQINKAIQYRFKHRDGNFVWVESLIKILDKSESNGLPKSYLSTTRSFQDRKEYEEKMMYANEQLEIKNQEIEMFAYITSHDMQEPLRMITNYLQLVQSKLGKMGDESLNDFINYAVNSAKNLQTLVKDILVYSTTNKIQDTGNILSMDTLLNEITTDLQMIIEERDVSFNLPKDYISIKADKNGVRQIFQNIILNGIKYNTSENPTVTIECSKLENEVVYTITDNGIGIEKVYWDKIFEPFQRLHGKGEHSGTGLGLPICKRIIEKMRGKIWLESSIGIGSRFYLSFKI